MEHDTAEEFFSEQAQDEVLSAHDTKLEAELRSLLTKLPGQDIAETLFTEGHAALRDISNQLSTSGRYVRSFRQDTPVQNSSASKAEQLQTYLAFGTDDGRWKILFDSQAVNQRILSRLNHVFKASRLDFLNKSLRLHGFNPNGVLRWHSRKSDPTNPEEEALGKQYRWLEEIIRYLSICIEMTTSHDFFSLLWEYLFGPDSGNETGVPDGRREDHLSLPVESSCQPTWVPSSAEPLLDSLEDKDTVMMMDVTNGQNFISKPEESASFDVGRVRELPYEIQWKIGKYVEFNRIILENTLRRDSRPQTESVALQPKEKKKVTLDVLPFDVWRKIIRYVEDDDSVLYSCIEASDKFRTLLREETRDQIARPEYWRDALIRRGVNVFSYPSTHPKEDTKNWNDGLWYDRYKKYVKTLACFRCFSRLSNITSGKLITTQEFHGRISIEATRLSRGQAAAAEENQDHLARPRLKDIGIQVLGVQFCDWDIAKSPAQQTSFDNLIVTLLGPPNTPYVGGRFQLLIHFPVAFPFEPPQARMLTKIVSPYFTDHGDFYYKFNSVCGGGTNPSLPTYREYWLLIYDIGYIVNIVARYLTFTDLDKADGETPAQLIVVNKKHNEVFERNRVAFDAQARHCTAENAMAHWNVSSKGSSS